MLLPGFTLDEVAVKDGAIRLRRGGSGPPLLLLHGNPQTHLMWHAVAPKLAERFTVVCPDLRGYGGSLKPPATSDHAPHAKREMARDMVEVMERLGHRRFRIGSHDRGARVAHRLVLDFPDRVERLAVLDIVPTVEHFERTDMAFALGYYHWFWFAQPHPFPELVINAAPEAWFHAHTSREPKPPGFFHPDALADYLAAARNPDTIRGMCEDYRAAASIDLEHDRASRAAGAKVQCPLLVLWGAKGKIGQWYDPLAIWRQYCAAEVTGGPVDSGHYLAEEAAGAGAAEVRGLLRVADGAPRRHGGALGRPLPARSLYTGPSSDHGRAMTATPEPPNGAAPGETVSFGFRAVPEEARQGLVNEVFTSVAGRYDLMNDLMSGGLHRLWKDELVGCLAPPRSGRPFHLLDVAGGTGDITLKALRAAGPGCTATLLDINAEMVEVGRKRVADAGFADRVAFTLGNAEALPFADRTFDAYTIAFGIRNVTHIDRVLAEAFRVLKRGGRFLCLEFSACEVPLLDRLYDFHSFQVIPRLGQLAAGDADAYRYLVESIRRFPRQEPFAEMVRAAGFSRVSFRNLTGGIAAIHSGWRT